MKHLKRRTTIERRNKAARWLGLHRGTARAVVTLSAILTATSAVAVDPTQDPSNWSLEARISGRLDPSRVAAAHEAHLKSMGYVVDPGATVVVIDGGREPELFLPIELFRQLISLTSGDDEAAKIWRSQLRPVLVRWNVEKTFWTTLRKAARPYIENVESTKRLAQDLVDSSEGMKKKELLDEIEKTQNGRCDLGFQALRLTEKAVGREMLYDLLYHGVAPHTKIVSDVTDPKQLRELAVGCES